MLVGERGRGHVRRRGETGMLIGERGRGHVRRREEKTGMLIGERCRLKSRHIIILHSLKRVIYRDLHTYTERRH